MCATNPKLSGHGKVLRNTIEYKNSFYKAISAEANTKHGFNAHAVILDELHVFPDRDLYDVLKTSTGARTQPLVIAITTAGHDTSAFVSSFTSMRRRSKKEAYRMIHSCRLSMLLTKMMIGRRRRRGRRPTRASVQYARRTTSSKR